VSRPRRIVVNTAIYLHGTSGSATATRALVDALRSLPDAEVIEVSPPSRGGSSAWLNAYRDARWDLWGAARAVPDVDLLVSPCNIGLRGPARRHLLVVHDTMALDHPEWFDVRFAAYFRMLVPPSVRRADRVVVPSAWSRARVLAHVPLADVRVVPWPAPRLVSPPATWPQTMTVLMVGATEPVKNHAAGVRAVAELRRQTGRDIRLRLIGRARRAEGEVRRALVDVDPGGRWTSREVHVSAETLAAAYVSSWLLLQPSFDEGYGLPLLEAASAGLPAVHSGRGAMSEVAPSLDAGSIGPSELAMAMGALLEESAWQEASRSARARAYTASNDRFRAAMHKGIRDLLLVPA